VYVQCGVWAMRARLACVHKHHAERERRHASCRKKEHASCRKREEAGAERSVASLCGRRSKRSVPSFCSIIWP
jgi:hypothetical protein